MCEYVGELITCEEAKRREVLYGGQATEKPPTMISTELRYKENRKLPDLW